MKYIFEEWQQVLDEYARDIKKDLAEIRRYKEEIQEMKTDFFNTVAKGYYRRDDERIVLSAPEIIIGDVDKEGNLWMNHEHSKVIIRSNNIQIEGVSSRISDDNDEAVGGSITCKAASIKNLAVDPGPYGNESVVHSNVSEIVSLAKAIKVSTIDTKGFIPDGDASATEGVTIHSGSKISIDASVSNEKLGQTLATQKGKIEKTIADLENSLGLNKDLVTNDINTISNFYSEAEKLGHSVEDIRCNSARMMDIRNDIDKKMPVLYRNVNDYLVAASDLANANREKQCIEDEIQRLNDEKSSFKDNATEASLSINAEQILISTKDGDGNFKTSSSVDCSAKSFTFNSTDNDNKLAEEGQFYVNSKYIVLSANQKTNDIEKKKISDTPTGKVSISGLVFDINAQSYVQNSENKTIESQETTPGSLMTIAVETTLLDSLDKQGKNTGSLSLNSKNILIAAVDRDDKGNMTNLSDEGKIAVVSNTMNFGSYEELLSKEVSVEAESIGLQGTQEVVIMQGEQEAKAAMDMTDGKINIAGDEIDETGTLTIESETEFKAAVKGKEAEFTKVTAKSGLKGPNLEDK